VPVFREVAGSHAFYFSGLEGEELARAVLAWQALKEAGTAPASSGMPWLKWEDNARALLEILHGRREEHLWAPGLLR